jgi:exopolysaccharide biosynthesis polyprenyl glycosylphosphotransferase
MKSINPKTKSLLIIWILVGFSVLTVGTAWATLSFVKADEVSPEFIQVNNSELLSVWRGNTKSRAPEPGTLVLLGGGFFGMIIGFVRRIYAFVKRVFDFVVTILGVIILSPLLLITAIVVKLTSKGPILYSQIRVGQDGHHFKMYKVRTMKVDAEKDTGPIWATANDPRLTPVGGFMRKIHIDELPQMINIIKGEMSLIGPRPERPVFVEKFKEEIPNYEKRLAVKPGITGLAQVWHRYDETIEDVKKKLKYDLLYIKRMCFWADFNILLRTVRVVITGEGAR